MRGSDRAEVQSRLHLPAEGSFARPESELVRTLYDCPDVPVGSAGQRCRVIVATHPTGETKRRVGVERGGIAYSLFLTKLPQQAFTASDVVALYLHRGAYAPTLADEDQEQDEGLAGVLTPPAGRNAGRSSRNGCGTRLLELGHQLEPSPLRTTEAGSSHSRGV
jgi:hypothetical protein